MQATAALFVSIRDGLTLSRIVAARLTLRFLGKILIYGASIHLWWWELTILFTFCCSRLHTIFFLFFFFSKKKTWHIHDTNDGILHVILNFKILGYINVDIGPNGSKRFRTTSITVFRYSSERPRTVPDYCTAGTIRDYPGLFGTILSFHVHIVQNGSGRFRTICRAAWEIAQDGSEQADIFDMIIWSYLKI